MKAQLSIFLLCIPFLVISQKPRLVVPIGHADSVIAVAFSPNGGNFVLTGSTDGTAKLWDRAGREIQTFSGHTAALSLVAFSPDGQTILTAGKDHTARLWDLNGQEIRIFSGHEAAVIAATFSPDGKFVLTGSMDGTAKLWAVSGELIRTFNENFGMVTSLAFSPSGKRILTGNFRAREKGDLASNADFGSKILCYDLKTGEKIWSTAIYSGRVSCAAYSQKGNFITGAMHHGTVVLFDPETGLETRSFKDKFSRITTISSSPDERHILAGGYGEVDILDLRSGDVAIHFVQNEEFNPYPEADVFCINFSAANKQDPIGGAFLLTGGKYGAVLWEKSGPLLASYCRHSEAVTTLSFADTKAGKFLLMGGLDGTSTRWQLDRPGFNSFENKNRILAIASSPDGANCLAGDNLGNVFQWDRKQKKARDIIIDYVDVSALAFSTPAEKIGPIYVALGTTDNSIKIWETGKNALRTTIEKPTRQVRMMAAEIPRPQQISALAFSSNDGGKQILSGDWDNQIDLWDRDSGTLIKSFGGQLSEKAITLQDFLDGRVNDSEGHSDYISCLAFSPDGQLALSGSADQTAKLWEVPSGKMLHTFSGHTQTITSLAFSPDGALVLTGSLDGTAKLWNSQTGELIHTFSGHAVSALAFTPDGDFFVSGSPDNTAKIWNLHTGEQLAALVTIDGNDWVVSTPGGLFDASPGAMKLMHYVFELEVIELEQLKERYYEPGLLQKLLGYSSEPLRIVDSLDVIDIYPRVSTQLDTAQNKLHIRLSPRNGGIGKVGVFVNGKEIIEDANPPKGLDKIRDTVLAVDLAKYARYFLFDSLNTVTVRAWNAAGWLKSAPQNVRYRPSFAQSKIPGGGTGGLTGQQLYRKPALYVLAVGTADYVGTQLDLKYSGKDACDMAAALQQVGVQLFGTDSVSVQLFTTDTSDVTMLPDRANIKAAFERIKKRAKAEDILVVYFSGHGVSYGDADQALFYYLTKDIASENLSDAGIRDFRTISSADLTKWINDIPAQKQVLILDACNSGRVIENMAAGQKELSASQIRALDRMKDRTGMYVLTGSAADKLSYEAGQYGQSLLTYSLLEGMSGLALTTDKRVDVSTLFQYARDQVPELAKGIGGVQVPMLVGPAAGSFDIGVVNENVHIKLEQVKPVFIRNNFQDQFFGDSLQLSLLLDNYFRELTAKGASADLIFVDVPRYQNAYSIRGRYTVQNGSVQLRGRLFKDQTAIGTEFQVTGQSSDVQALVEAVVEKVSEML